MKGTGSSSIATVKSPGLSINPCSRQRKSRLKSEMARNRFHSRSGRLRDGGLALRPDQFSASDELQGGSADFGREGDHTVFGQHRGNRLSLVGFAQGIRI